MSRRNWYIGKKAVQGRYTRTIILSMLFIFSMLALVPLSFSQVISPEIELHAIIRDIPGNWWNGGWDKLEELQVFLSKHVDNPALGAKAQFYIGCYYYSIREYKKAIETYTALINTYPAVSSECCMAQFEIGQIYLHWLNEPNQAIIEYQKVVQNYPNDPLNITTQLMIGKAYRRLNNMTQAKAVVQGLIDSYPTAGVESYIELGDIYIAESKAREAISSYKKAYLICPSGDSYNLQMVINKICSGLKLLDMSMARANQFLKYQKYGSAGEDGKAGTGDDLANPVDEF